MFSSINFSVFDPYIVFFAMLLAFDRSVNLPIVVIEQQRLRISFSGNRLQVLHVDILIYVSIIDTTSYNIHEKSTKQPHQSQGRANL